MVSKDLQPKLGLRVELGGLAPEESIVLFEIKLAGLNPTRSSGLKGWVVTY